MAKANAVTGTSYYVAEGAPVPDELHPDVRLVGPGAPVPVAEAETAADGSEAGLPPPMPDEAYAPDSVPLRPNASAPKADRVAYAVAADEELGHDEADALSKDELRKRYG